MNREVHVRICGGRRLRCLRLPGNQDPPPTWRGAFIKSVFVTIVMALIVILVFGQDNQVILLGPIVLLGYTVVTYYTDKRAFQRRQRLGVSQT